MIVLLDSGPLGILTNPKGSAVTVECRMWVRSLLLKGYKIKLPEIADYEVRRELLRAKKLAGVKRLDDWKQRLEYLPITTPVILKAAELWAQSRQAGMPTADPKELDGDVILAAQALLEGESGEEVVIATTNVGHLSRFIDARKWQNIE
ncbi:MAG: type II toxin-antitoxin system VapC family toxin [Oscillatoriales cyanobacterium RU_3_3]|nr:type II toxin-antitoxin system VapC family toxin [Microcoleus sp. SU_5_6]NJL67634.1 type II toxin-antitoxin system VapC family toxin [Microcoleus sp. SM1_3_4]NJM59476.1 type II toxin-antitoxin system VapC family toxin [Oscillatoriales cyanobacterium RU_3_3]NJR21984.1 type II toxin-antitoxin system VapC family toxin [Richelia sp. CSU_2_1]